MLLSPTANGIALNVRRRQKFVAAVVVVSAVAISVVVAAAARAFSLLDFMLPRSFKPFIFAPLYWHAADIDWDADVMLVAPLVYLLDLLKLS